MKQPKTLKLSPFVSGIDEPPSKVDRSGEEQKNQLLKMQARQPGSREQSHPHTTEVIQLKQSHLDSRSPISVPDDLNLKLENISDDGRVEQMSEVKNEHSIVEMPHQSEQNTLNFKQDYRADAAEINAEELKSMSVDQYQEFLQKHNLN